MGPFKRPPGKIKRFLFLYRAVLANNDHAFRAHPDECKVGKIKPIRFFSVLIFYYNIVFE